MFPNNLWFTTDVTWWRRRARPVPVYTSLILHFLPPGQCGLFDAPPGRMFSQHPQHRDESTVTLFLKLCSWRMSWRCPAGLHRGDHSILREKRFKGARAAGRTWLKTCTLSVLSEGKMFRLHGVCLMGDTHSVSDDLQLQSGFSVSLSGLLTRENKTFSELTLQRQKATWKKTLHGHVQVNTNKTHQV